jgi:hypothetical protein
LNYNQHQDEFFYFRKKTKFGFKKKRRLTNLCGTPLITSLNGSTKYLFKIERFFWSRDKYSLRTFSNWFNSFICGRGAEGIATFVVCDRF